MTKETRVLLGVIGKPYGVRGQVRVHSYTDDPDALADYSPLQDENGALWDLRWRGDGIAELREHGAGKPMADRTAVEKLVNMKLYIERDQLPPPDDDEFYLTDLMGLQARDADDRPLGQVTQYHDYGAGVSLEIAAGKGVIIVPFTMACVPELDVKAGWLRVIVPDQIEVKPEDMPAEAPSDEVPEKSGGDEA